MILTNGHLYDPSLRRKKNIHVRLFLWNNVRLISRDHIFSQNHNQKDDQGLFFCYKEVRLYNQGQSIDILGSNPVEKYLAKQRLRTMCVVKYLKKV
jgi:hypothetical protein